MRWLFPEIDKLMFNLETAIAKWRQQMRAAGIKTPVPLEELESHLREDIERQMSIGINAGTAFKTAAQRMGQSDLLKAEFSKVTGIKGVQWGKVVGVICCLAALPLPAWAVPRFLTVPELTTSERLLGSAAVLLTFLSLASWRFSYRFLPVIHDREKRLKTTITFGLGGLAWFYVFVVLLFTVIVRRLFSPSSAWQTGELGPNFNMGVAALWAMALTAVLGGIAYGLEEAARRQQRNDVYA